MKKLLLASAALGLGLAACSQEAESDFDTAGEEIGEAADATGDAIGTAAEDAVGQAEHAADETGQAIEGAAHDVEEELN